MEIKIQRVDDNFDCLPVKGTSEAACFDVKAREIIKVDDGYYKVKIGFKSEIPVGYGATVKGRSSITDTGWFIPNAPGTIDSDFRGEWQVRFRAQPNGAKFTMSEIDNCVKGECESEIIPSIALTYPEFPYKVGDRIAQIELFKVLDTQFELVKELSETDRGEGGHGSTGLK